jgi:hypothetical protein
MHPDRRTKIEELYRAVIAIPKEQHAEFLEHACPPMHCLKSTARDSRPRMLMWPSRRDPSDWPANRTASTASSALKGFFSQWLADWGRFAAAPNNSLITVSDSNTYQIYALEWDAR